MNGKIMKGEKIGIVRRITIAQKIRIHSKTNGKGENRNRWKNYDGVENNGKMMRRVLYKCHVL